MTIKQLHQLFLGSKGISTDTRKISKDILFFALRGDNFNGNKFTEEAFLKGASHAIIDDIEFAKSPKTILVDDVLQTLQELATFHRNYLNLPIISLTGSNGKTTTKELINAVLSKKHKTVATKGNLNNHIGVPLTLLSMTKDTSIGIVEMGANHLMEIDQLCKIVQPNYGYITNFGKAHLEGFGSIEGVIKGKSELYDYLLKDNKYIFLNADDSIQKEKLNSHIKKIGFSQNNSEFYIIRMTNSKPFVKVFVEDVTITSNLIGSYNFTNIAVAILIGKFFNIELDDIKEAIENYVPTNNRSQILDKGSNKIILDAYNANPTSMKAALESFSNLSGRNKIAILGDMFELGEESKKEHQYIVNLIETLEFDQIYLVGENFYTTESSKSYIHHFKSFNELKVALNGKLIKDASILIKGSRGMALEKTLDFL